MNDAGKRLSLRRGVLMNRRGARGRFRQASGPGVMWPAMAVCLAALMLVAAVARAAESAAPSVTGESKEQRDRRMAWWREAKFGMFIHWGLYSIPGGVWNGKDIVNSAEWIMFRAKVSRGRLRAAGQPVQPR